MPFLSPTRISCSQFGHGGVHWTDDLQEEIYWSVLGVLVIALYLRSKDWVEEFSSADVFKVLEIKISAGLG